MQLRITLRGSSFDGAVRALRIRDAIGNWEYNILYPEYFVSGPTSPVFESWYWDDTAQWWIQAPQNVEPPWTEPWAPYSAAFLFNVTNLPEPPKDIARIYLVNFDTYDATEVIVEASEDGVTFTEIGYKLVLSGWGGDTYPDPDDDGAVLLDWSLLAAPGIPEFWTNFNLTYEIP